MEQVLIPALPFPLSESFHKFFKLILILKVLLSEGRAGKTWGPPNKAKFIYVSVSGQSSMLYFPIFQTAKKPTLFFKGKYSLTCQDIFPVCVE
jgi:hypothetical protein